MNTRFRPRIRRGSSPVLLALVIAASVPSFAAAQSPGTRVPGDDWLAYANVEEAGFDPVRLEAARETWKTLPSSAFLVIAGGAVVTDWGETQRRFMCHSVRKSFLSGLYGIYWDRGEIELNKTMADLGIDDEPDPLLESEKRARILDLLKARSGVFHPAAYAGRTDSRPRGSEGPGRYFAYNNWDFNTLASILMQETGDDVFESFDEHFARPLGMEDWRISDGYYHYERDKSMYPAYPFRMSARDAARFGLLYAREGLWGDERILSEHWIRRSSALYSIDSENMGYGFMWWVFLDPRFERYGAYAALGVGNQMIAVFPEIDIVIVNRANTYAGEGTPPAALADLVAQVLAARTGAPAADAALVPVQDGSAPGATRVDTERLDEFEGTWAYPAPILGLPPYTEVRLEPAGGHLKSFAPVAGSFALYLQEDGTFLEEDSYRRYFPIRDDGGAFAGIADAEAIANAAVLAAADGDSPRARELLGMIQDDESVQVAVARAVSGLLAGDVEEADRAIRDLARDSGAPRIEAEVNGIGYALLQTERPDEAIRVFEFNTRVFPDAFNTWDSLGEVCMELGRKEEAIRHYERSLELNPENANATAMIERIRSGETP
jgi:CubicO group peptidase (beta-lactamase class C family)/Flp pilus assembly protein TadD